jgi:transcriptional regulator with XRE-family HTH domain
MVDRRVMEKEAVTLTGLRIKAARVLTNLNQESFAEKFSFGYASVKNWELGRSIPREDTVNKILGALNECGVDTTRDWLLFGLGSGPTHIGERNNSYSMAMKSDADLTLEIAQFEKMCVRNNMRPLVVTVSDDLMAPLFFKGDVIGAESVDLKTVTLKTNIFVNYPFLVEIMPGIFQPRLLSCDEAGSIKFWRTQQASVVGNIKHTWLGKIIWIRRPSLSIDGDK